MSEQGTKVEVTRQMTKKIYTARSLKRLVPLWAVLFFHACCAPQSFATDKERVSEAIRELGKDKSHEVRMRAAEDLMEVDEPTAATVAPILVGWLRERDPELSMHGLNCLTVLLSRHKKTPVPIDLVEAMFDKDASVRWTAANCVEELHAFPKGTRPLLLRAVQHEDPHVRKGAVCGLAHGWSDDKDVVAIVKKHIRDKDALVRQASVSSYFEITDDYDTVVPYWLQMIETEGKGIDPPAENDEAPEVLKILATFNAGWLLEVGKKHPVKLGKSLLKLLEDESAVNRRGAAHAIEAVAKNNEMSKTTFRDLNASHSLRILRHDRDASVREAAARALATLEE